MVFGGTGPTGKVFLKYIAKKDVQIVAVSRNPDKVKEKYANVKWVKGDPKDGKSYSEDMKGCGVVFSLLGSEDKKHVDVYSKGYPEIIKTMEANNVHRLIFVSAMHDHPDQPFIFKHFVKPTFLSHMFDDMVRMDAFFKSYTGPVKYTNVRPSRILDEGKRKKDAKEKVGLAYTNESKGWTFECYPEFLAEVLLRSWEKAEYENKIIDAGCWK